MDYVYFRNVSTAPDAPHILRPVRGEGRFDEMPCIAI